jgi:hypothetical protein
MKEGHTHGDAAIVDDRGGGVLVEVYLILVFP